MISLFPDSQYEPHDLTFNSNMVCKWSHAGTTLTLIEMNWYRNIRTSFHLLVEEQNESSSIPVSLGINYGWNEIQAGIKQQIPPPELLQIILRMNPDLEKLVLDNSPNTQRLDMLQSVQKPIASPPNSNGLPL
jgi:hypothetical protein